MSTYLDGRVEVVTGDITHLEVDAIVNAANGSLLGGGGVDGAIHRAGGPEILAACREVRRTRWPKAMPTGQAVATTAGRLPCEAVIHTVGPVWRGSDPHRLLRAAYLNSLRVALEGGWQRVAFPAISTGIYGYPREEAAREVSAALTEHFGSDRTVEQVTLVFFARGDAEAFMEATTLR
jgi:O-acetyl-ADP-ribose deacetylase